MNKSDIDEFNRLVTKAFMLPELDKKIKHVIGIGESYKADMAIQDYVEQEVNRLMNIKRKLEKELDEYDGSSYFSRLKKCLRDLDEYEL